MTVKELDALIPITYIYGDSFFAKKYSGYFAFTKYSDRKVKDIEIDWEGHEINVWVEKEESKGE